MDNLINSIVDSIDKKIPKFKNDLVVFSKSGYKPIEITESNFYDVKVGSVKQRVAFVDGGNAPIILTPNLCLQLIKVYGVVFDGKNRVYSDIAEFFLLINSSYEEGKLMFRSEVFIQKGEVELDESDLVFDSLDPLITNGGTRADITKIGNIVRDLIELKFAKKIISELKKGDIVVRDGTLECNLPIQQKVMDEIYETASEKNVVVIGLAKTSKLFTNNGNNVSGLLNELKEKGSWYYYPIVEINNETHKADMYFVKLYDKSNHVFRFEVYKSIKYDISEVLSVIMENSTDPVMLGYPYGLIFADKFARVANIDVDYIKTKIAAMFGDKWHRIKKHINSINAHEILDNIG